MKRYGQVIRVRPGKLEEYWEYHRAVFPGAAKMITECNIRNYSIFHWNGLLFAYFEYVGDDFAADAARMAADPETQRWWDVVKPLQEPVEDCGPDEWWKPIDEVFHQD